MFKMDRDLADSILDLFATRNAIVKEIEKLERQDRHAGRTNATSE